MRQKRRKTLIVVPALLASLILQVAPVRAAGGVPINEANFPDAGFREIVRAYDTNEDGTLQQSELDAVTRISSGDKNITDLKGVEHFTKLEKLYCYFNKIETLDLTNNKLLTTLDCSRNKLQSLDLSQNTELECLRCSENPFPSLDLSHNTKLTELSFYHNRVDFQTLDLSRNTALTSVICYNSRIQSIDVSRCTALEALSCSGNDLQSLDIRNNKKLKNLNCSNNPLQSLDISNNTELRILECAQNQLKSLNISQHTKLETLDCGSNQLKTLNVGNHPKLTRLYCYGNQLTSLNVSNNPDLLQLDCSLNQLTFLDLSRPTPLEELYCSINELRFLDVSKQTQLVVLNCFENQLTSLDVSKNPNLSSLLCELNQLAALDLSQNPNLGSDHTEVGEQTCPDPLYSELNGGRYEFDLSDLPDVAGANLANVSNVRQADGSPLPAGASYDQNTGILKIDPAQKIPGFVYDYNVKAPLHPDLRMGVKVNLTYDAASPLQIAVFRTGNQTTYNPGDTVALAARAEYGTTPYRYRFYVVRSNGSTVTLRDYAYNNVFNWKPVTPDVYRVGVNAKDAKGRVANREQQVTVLLPPIEPLKMAVFRAGNKMSYNAGEPVALAARAEGGTAPYRYRFYVVRSNGTRVTLRNYAYGNVFNWRPLTPDTYQVGVDVKDAKGKIVNQEKPVTVLPVQTHPPEIAVFRAGNKTNYDIGETVALAARAEGGTTPYRYRFYVVRSNGTRVTLRNYAYGNVFNWRPLTPDTYQVGVDVKDAKGKVVNQAKTVTVRPAVPDPLRVAVFRVGSKDEYQVGETIALAARGAGGSGALRYQFYTIPDMVGEPIVLKDYSGTNIFSWKPQIPGIYKVYVAIRDATGTVVEEQRKIGVGMPLP